MTKARSARRKTPPTALRRRKSSGAVAPPPIVGVGASAGGLEAFTELLRHLPPDTGMAFVLVQHLDPEHESALARLLSRATSMPVQDATNDLRVESNHVYVIPRNRNLAIAEGVLKTKPRPARRAPQRTIDFFFESLAQDQRERAIGVILSGTATDGTLGLEAIKAEGGITFAQDESARYDSMPKSAAAAGCVDFVLSPEAIAQELARIARHPYVAAPSAELVAPEDGRALAVAHEDDAPPLPSGSHGAPRTGARQARDEAARGAEPGSKAEENGFRQILQLLHRHSGVDFSLYKSATIQRRIARRMVLRRHDTPDDYVRSLRGNSNELNALYSDVLISVTSFFRNPEAFDVLRRRIFPKLLQQRGSEPLRVWVLGCSTGQEAYSIAMAFTESLDKAKRVRGLQVFATDLNDALLDKARQGLYAKSLAHEVSPERLRRFFVEEQGGYCVNKALRETVVFARQNFITDPPFSRMDLISCRNVLIYVDTPLQQRAIPTFHYALKPGGYLFLGASESIGGFTSLFAPTDKKHKIYAKKDAPTPAIHLPVKRERPRASAPPPAAAAQIDAGEAWRGEHNAQREADRITINQFAPPGVLINAALEVLQFRGPTGAYLQPPTGKASFDVLKMARKGLMLPLRAAINKAKKEHRPVRKEGVRIDQNGTSRTVTVEVIPLKNLGELCFLVLFEATGTRSPGRASPAVPVLPGPQPKPARAGAKEESRHVAKLESELLETRDYLQSVQEQHEAANEELQAANEEVQSANEELQSINEELETSKEELESSNEELTTLNEEMANRNAELSLANSDLTNLQASTRLALVLLGRDLTIRRFSEQAARQLHLTASDIGRPFGHVRHGLVFAAPRANDGRAATSAGAPRSGSARKSTAPAKPSLPDIESVLADVVRTVREQEHEVFDSEGRWHSLRVRPYLTADNRVDGAVLVLVDINALKRNERIVAAARDYAESIVQTARDPLLILDDELRIDSANSAFYSTFKVSAAEALGRTIYELGNGQWDIPRLRHLLEDVLPRNSFFNDFEVTHDFETIGRRTMLLNARVLRPPGRPAGILLGIQDITEILQFQTAARKSAERFKLLFERSPLPKWLIDLNTLRFLDVNEAAIEHYGYRRDEFLRMGMLDVWTPEAAAELKAVLARPPHRPPEEEIVRHRTKSGEVISVEIRANEIDLDGKPAWLATINDVTARRRAENAARDADRHKDEFLAMLAHELRGPLAPLAYALEIATRDPDNRESVRQMSDMMKRQLGVITRLIDDLLDVSRISRGKLALRRTEVELASVIRQAVEACRPVIDAAAQELTVAVPSQPIWLRADAIRLTQVFANLLSNASKFSAPKGRIALTAEERDGEVVVTVKDSGAGIPADMLDSIFDMFTQVDRSKERARGGLGIGLTLVKQLVELHGGSVRAASDGPGQGSEFVVRIPGLIEKPAGKRKAAPASIRAPTSAAGRRVLVVDDNADTATSIATLLNMVGYETRVAHDGIAAVDAAAAFKPHVVLLDIGLPRLSGYGAAQRIRRQPSGKGMVLIALTGWGQRQDRQESDEAGFDAHLVKPVEADTLMKVLAQAQQRKADRG